MKMGKKYNVTVATSDGLEQIIIRGQGCRLLSARELKDEIERTKKTLFEEHPQESKKAIPFPKRYAIMSEMSRIIKMR